MIKRIDLFMPPRGRYGVLHHFTRKLHEAFQRNGINSRVLEAQRDNPGPFLSKIFDDPPDCTLSFNGLLPDDEGRFFCDLIKIPHVACLVDSPNHFFSLIKSPYNIITCVDRFSCDFFKGMHFDNVFFMPHGVDKNLCTPSDESKTYDVLSLSSCIDYEAIGHLWEKKYPKNIRQAMFEAAEATLADSETSYVQAFVKSLDPENSQINARDFTKFDFVEMLDELELYIRGLDRVNLIKSIKDARVDIFGAGNTKTMWEKYLGKKSKNVTIHEEVTFDQALELMKHSKLLLNSCPWIKNGGHERIFAGLICEILVLTNENIYMRENFTDNVDILFYRTAEMDRINAKINDILQNDDMRKKIAKKGREKVLKYHTWDSRVTQLIKDIDPVVKNINSSRP